MRRCTLVALYVISSVAGAGKTAVGAGIGRHLADNGRRVGFLKPVTADDTVDNDAVFMKRILALEEPLERICPVITDQNSLVTKIKEAGDGVSAGKDVVIIEGKAGAMGEARKVLDALEAKGIVVEAYPKSPPVSTYKELGEPWLGIVLNRVPQSQLERVRTELSTRCAEAGINLLGVLPEDRALFTLSVAELAEHLQGEILGDGEQTAELVENLMLGAMYVGSGLRYFGRKGNKAVIVSSKRTDMQLAALETSTRCLIISGDTPPVPSVIHRARDKKVPIILVKEDIPPIVTKIEEALGKTRFNQERKLPRLAEIMGQHFNFPVLYQGLGLAK